MAVFFLFLRNVLLPIEILKIKILEHSDPPSQHFFVHKAFSHSFLCRRKVVLCHLAEWHTVEPSVPELKGQVSFDCGSWDGPLKTSLVTMWELMKPSWCPHPNAGLIWDMTADITLDLDDDASLHDLAMIHPLLAIKLTKQRNNPSTKPSEGSASSDCTIWP